MQNPFKFWQVSAGRTGRLDWLLGQMGWLAAMLISCTPLLIPALLKCSDTLTYVLFIPVGLVGLIGTIGVINLDIRRLHDIGLSGWFVLIPFVLGLIGKLAPQIEVVTSFIASLFFLGLLLIPGRLSALKIEVSSTTPSPNPDIMPIQNEQPPQKVEVAKECDAKKGLCVAALVLVALIALGLAWAFRLESVGTQDLGFGYYRNRWTGTMYVRTFDRIETAAQRDKRLKQEQVEEATRLERERVEEETRKANEREREAARLEKERIQRESEEKSIEEEARKVDARAREAERLGQERSRHEMEEKAATIKAQAAKEQGAFDKMIELRRIDEYRLSLSKMIDEHPTQMTFDIVGKQYPRKAIEEVIATLSKKADELRPQNASFPAKVK